MRYARLRPTLAFSILTARRRSAARVRDAGAANRCRRRGRTAAGRAYAGDRGLRGPPRPSHPHRGRTLGATAACRSASGHARGGADHRHSGGRNGRGADPDDNLRRYAGRALRRRRAAARALRRAMGLGTMSELYTEMSRGKFKVTGQVHDWVHLPEGEGFYAGPAGCNGLCNDLQLGEPSTTALEALDASIDFSRFDNNGPGQPAQHRR